MENLYEYIEILKTLPGLNVENFVSDGNIMKAIPCLDLIGSTEELNAAIEYAQNHGIELVTNMGTLKRFELLSCIVKALDGSVEQNMSQGRAI